MSRVGSSASVANDTVEGVGRAVLALAHHGFEGYSFVVLDGVADLSTEGGESFEMDSEDFRSFVDCEPLLGRHGDFTSKPMTFIKTNTQRWPRKRTYFSHLYLSAPFRISTATNDFKASFRLLLFAMSMLRSSTVSNVSLLCLQRSQETLERRRPAKS